MKTLLIIALTIVSFISCKTSREVVESTSRDSLQVESATATTSSFEEYRTDTVFVPADKVEINLDSLCRYADRVADMLRVSDAPISYGEGRAKLKLINDAVRGTLISSNCDSLKLALASYKKLEFNASAEASQQQTKSSSSTVETKESHCVIPWFFKAAMWFSIITLIYIALKVVCYFYFPFIKIP